MAIEVADVAKALGSAIEDVRNEAMANVPTWLREAPAWSEEMAMKLWKGMFYAMWNLDGEESQREVACRWTTCLLDKTLPMEVRQIELDERDATLRREWITIDQYRLDKYYMLGRQMLHAVCAASLRGTGEAFLVVLGEEVMDCVGIASGIPGHFVEIFFDEFTKAREEAEAKETWPEAYVALLGPFRRTLLSDRRARLKHKILYAQLAESCLRAEASVGRSLVLRPLQRDAESAGKAEQFGAALQQLGLQSCNDSAATEEQDAARVSSGPGAKRRGGSKRHKRQRQSSKKRRT